MLTLTVLLWQNHRVSAQPLPDVIDFKVEQKAIAPVMLLLALLSLATPRTTSAAPATNLVPIIVGTLAGVALTSCLVAIGIYRCRKESNAKNVANP
jgi:hypothetical protein